MRKGFNVKEIALIGVLGGVCTVLMMFRFPLPLMPPFMAFDLAGVVEIIGGFLLGPVQAIAIILVKTLIQVAVSGISSAFVGELQSVLLSLAYVLPAILIYHHQKVKKRAIYGMIVGSVVCAVVAIFTNLYIIIPFYIRVADLSIGSIINMCKAVNPLVTDKLSLALFGIIPFNLIKSVINSILTLILYKRISQPLKRIINR